MSSTERQQTVRVVSARVRLRQRLRDLWAYRELFVGLVRKELKVKYKDSILGFLWSMLNPALYLVVFYIVFQVILGSGIPQFAIFLLSGLLVWNLFSSALPASTGSVVGNSAIVKKVAFPREILAIAPVGASTVHFFLQSLVLVIALVIFKHGVAWSYMPLLIPALIALLLFSAALGILLGAVNVYFRDMQHMLELALLAWFWATPIVYQYRLVADKAAAHPILYHIYRLNPITPIVLTFQRAIYNRLAPIGNNGQPVKILPPAPPSWYLWQLCVVIVGSIIFGAIALVIFGRLEGNFAEEL
jgi:ABC-2 type transport system permease protein